MNFHPDKQLLQDVVARDQTTDPWITKPALYLYTMGDPLAFSSIITKVEMEKDIHVHM